MIHHRLKRNISLLLMVFCCISTSLFAQQRMVKGIVMDENGEALIGVSVTVKNAQKGTITDIDGKFSILLSPEKTILVFSYIGYETAAVNAANQKDILLKMKPASHEIEDVVVVGYGTLRKSDLTGSVGTVNVTDTKNLAIVSADQMMQGRVSGVDISSNNGAPGGGISIKIRGAATISGSTTPLYVIDGLPIDNYVSTPSGTDNQIAMQPATNPLANINPNEIESIEIMKDASATAIYGSRGANGVILITTKQGNKGKTKVEYSGRMDVSNIIRKYDLLTTSEYAQFENEHVDSWNRQNPTTTPKAYPYSVAAIDSLKQFDGIRKMQDLIYQEARSQDHQITISGADDKSNYLFSANYLNQVGIVKNSSLDRLGFRLNYGRELLPGLRIDTKINYTNTVNHTVVQSQATGDLGGNAIFGALVFSPLRNIEDINLDSEYADETTMVDSPFALIKYVKDILTQHNFIGNASLKYNFNKYLQLQVNGGLHKTFNVRDVYYSRGSSYGNSYRGLAFKGITNRRNLMMDVLLNYNRNFGKTHRINAVAGHTYQSWDGDNLTVRATDFMDDTMGNTNMAWGLASTRPNSYASQWGLESYLARVNYTLLDRYIITATGRSDGSTRLSKNNKWSFFPSAAVAWRINQEPFLKSVEAISNMKLKLSYGVSGNQNIGVGASQWTMGVKYYPNNGVASQGIIPSSMPNDDLGWETTAQYNAGLETGFFNNRLRLNVDLYLKNTSNLLFNLPLPATSGYATYPVNLGEIENKGVDIDLSADILTGKLAWTLSGNISFNRNKVISLGDLEDFTGPTYLSSGGYPLNQPVHLIKVGEPVGALYGYVTNGVYQNAEEVAAGPESETAMPGDLKYVDVSGNLGVPDGKIDANDRTIIGNPYPKFTYGITNIFTYKGFTLNIFIQGSEGAQVANINRYVLDGMADLNLNSSRAAYYGAWRGEGTSNFYPAIRPSGIGNLLQTRFSTYLLDDASYIRLKTVSLSYNFNLKKSGFVNRLQIFASAINLLTITKYRGYDPEVSSFGGTAMTPGVDFGAYPTSKSMSAGLNITF